jgi:hypothetical protein
MKHVQNTSLIAHCNLLAATSLMVVTFPYLVTQFANRVTLHHLSVASTSAKVTGAAVAFKGAAATAVAGAGI